MERKKTAMQFDDMEEITKDPLMQLIMKLGVVLPNYSSDGCGKKDNAFLFNHEALHNLFANMFGITTDRKEVKNMVDNLKMRGKEYAHLLKFAAKKSLLLRERCHNLSEDVEDLKFAVKERNIEEARGRINHIKEISEKAVEEAKKIEEKHTALYDKMLADLENVSSKFDNNTFQMYFITAGVVASVVATPFVMTCPNASAKAAALAVIKCLNELFKAKDVIRKDLSTIKEIYIKASEALRAEREMWEGIQIAAEIAENRVHEISDLFETPAWQRIERRFEKRIEEVQGGFENLTHTLDVYLVYLREEGLLLPTIKLDLIIGEEAYEKAKISLDQFRHQQNNV